MINSVQKDLYSSSSSSSLLNSFQDPSLFDNQQGGDLAREFQYFQRIFLQSGVFTDADWEAFLRVLGAIVNLQGSISIISSLSLSLSLYTLHLYPLSLL